MSFNLRAWVTRALDKKCNDHEAMKVAALVRKEAKSNGYTDEDVSEMYRTINRQRGNDNE